MDPFTSPPKLAMDEAREKCVPMSWTNSPPKLSQQRQTPTSPTPRNERSPWFRHRLLPTSSCFLIIFLIISCCISLSSASHLYIDEQMIEKLEAEDASEDLESALARLAKTGTILVDPNPPTNPHAWMLATEHDDLQRRGLDSISSSSSSSSSSSKHASSSAISSGTSMTTTASTTLSSSSTSTSIATTATTAPSPLPMAFDQGFIGNITQSCQSFMDDMLANATFKSCLPFSLLLQNSNSFFQASKSLVRISQVLDVSCAASLPTCGPLIAALASNLTTSSACASDLANQNPLVEQAHLGLLAYKTLYTASCLRNPSTSSYCFADAVTNSSSPTDSYIYYLPLNISLPGGSQPTCDACLKNTMAVFESASSDRTSALASDYVSAAMQVNVQCGPSFVNQSLAAAVISGSRMEMVNPSVGIFALAMVVGSFLL